MTRCPVEFHANVADGIAAKRRRLSDTGSNFRGIGRILQGRRPGESSRVDLPRGSGIEELIVGVAAMDRDEALKLLKGGEKGIREWNARRQADEAIPDLTHADLSGAILSRANLSGAILSGASLSKANLSGAILRFANLGNADLRANLFRAILSNANLSGAILIEATLIRADLSYAILRGADLRGANLRGANLSSANLTEAILIRAMMVDVDLRGAKLCDCRIFGISVWNVKTDENTEQINLIIGDDSDPILTVDNLKVAQFIYLLLNNEEIRGVIDTITSKVVLILGRFTPERKVLLDALREELRRRDYMPVMFDFSKPESRGYTETIITLAGMARFIIADLKDAAEVKSELTNIASKLPSVPVQPLVLASSTEYVTSIDLRRYHWYLEPFRYEDLDDAIKSLPEMILKPAEAKVIELRR